MDNAGKWNIPIQDLLALPDVAAVAKATLGDDNGRSSSFVSFPNTHMEGRGVGTSPINVQLGNHVMLPRSVSQIQGKSTSDTQQCGPQVTSRNLFDLNSAPGTISEADFSMPLPTQFAPVTPDQTRGTESRQISNVRNLSWDERTNQAKEKQSIESTTARVVEQYCINLEEQTQLLQKQSCDAVSTQLQENPNSDKGANEGADLNKTPQLKPRRRKHRPKVVIEGQPKRTRKPRTPKADNPTETPTGKRKYVRRKGIEKPTATPAEQANETNDPKTVGQTRKFCWRSINFDAESNVNEEKSSCTREEILIAGVQLTVQLQQGMDRTGDKTDMGIAHELTQPTNQKLEGYLSIPKRQAPSLLTSNKTDPPAKSVIDGQSAYRRGKCQIHFSDETHDKEASAVESPNDSNYSNSACMNKGKQATGTKREHSEKIDGMEISTLNSIGAQYNSCQAYLPMFLDYSASFPLMHFPVIHKKKRTEKGKYSTTPSILSSVPTGQDLLRNMAPYPFSLESSCRFSDAQFNASNGPGASAVGGSQDEQQSFNCILAFDHTKKFKKKRTRGRTRVRDLASFAGFLGRKQSPTPNGAASGVMQELEAFHQRHTCADAPADIQVKLATRKRTKRNSSGSSMPFTPYHHQSAFSATGFLPRFIWKSMDPIGALIKQFEHLDINTQSSEVANQDQHALIPSYTRYQEKNALVLYQQDGTIVPYNGSFNQIRRRKPRPKVDLDDETTRV